MIKGTLSTHTTIYHGLCALFGFKTLLLEFFVLIFGSLRRLSLATIGTGSCGVATFARLVLFLLFAGILLLLLLGFEYLSLVCL